MRKILLLLAITVCAWAESSLLLIYSSECPHSVKVLHYLNEIGKTVPMKDVYRDPDAKQILKMEGGQMIVPCLLINHQPIYDCDDIITWLSQHQKELTQKT
ncbi:MAG: glutaredoxin [Verrucomicrobia bacterium]|nr:glutaredoxin [Verrucomicrobiota bacterium]